MLAFFPEDCRVGVEANLSFSSWLSQGYYSLINATDTSLVLECDSADFAKVWRSEVENLVNHCYEQLLEECQHISGYNRCSGAWAVVTGYYLSFFAAQAFIRLLGTPVMYLNGDQMRRVVTLFAHPVSPRPGTYRLTRVVNTVGDSVRCTFQCSGRKPHEETWKQFFRFIDAVWAAVYHNAAQNTLDVVDQNERLLLNAIRLSKHGGAYDSAEWPSLIRTAANYRMGFAYRQVLRQDVVACGGVMRGLLESKAEALVSYFYSTCEQYRSGSTRFKTEVEMMLSLGIIVFGMVRALQAELRMRRVTDARWEQLRKKFYSERYDEYVSYRCLIPLIGGAAA